MPPLTTIRGRAVLLAADDIDTDQIIPARFLTTTARRGLGAHLFADWRYAADGSPRPGFALNAPDAAGRRVLVGGRNFGCGSSREHASWAIADFGFQCVVAVSFADIFRSNALKNGVVPVALSPEAHATLVRRLIEDADTSVTVDVAAKRLAIGDDCWDFPLAPFARHCLLEGVDQLGYLLSAAEAIARYEARHPAPFATTA